MLPIRFRAWRGRVVGGEPWHVVVVAAIALALTGPGQTIGVSAFVDPMQEALGLSRPQVAGAYMVGTLLGSLAVPFAGRAIDRLGVRVVMALVGAAFAVATMAMAGVVGLVTLGAAFVGIRALGQGSLTLTATTAAGVAFQRRRGVAIGGAVAVGTALMGLTPVVLTTVIAQVGWRLAWIVAGLVVGLVVIPLGWFGLRAVVSPKQARADGNQESPAPGYTRAQALRTPLLWAITGATVSTGLIGTGMTFHQLSLLGEQGLTTTQAAANFVPQSVATIVATLLAGWLADRWSPRAVIPLAMGIQIAGMTMVVAGVVDPGLLAVVYAVSIGGSGGLARAFEAAATPRFYGTAHLGSIRGLIMAINVASTSLGPVALAMGFSVTGSYGTGLAWLLLLPLATSALALVARPPAAPTLAATPAAAAGTSADE